MSGSRRAERTETEWGPWTIVEATDRRYTRVKIFRTIVNTLEERLGIIPERLSAETQPGQSEVEPKEEPAEGDEEEESEQERVEEEATFAAAHADQLEEPPFLTVLPTPNPGSDGQAVETDLETGN
jgi:hypothetical protein